MKKIIFLTLVFVSSLSSAAEKLGSCAQDPKNGNYVLTYKSPPNSCKACVYDESSMSPSLQ